MKQFRSISRIMVLAGLLAASGLSAQSKDVTVKGEVLDQHCYMIHHGTGPDHAACSNACMNRNVSIGFLADSGQFYLLLGETLVSVKDQVAGMAGKPAIVTGVIAERDGIKAIQMKKIELSK
jgi:hypothetical protein